MKPKYDVIIVGAGPAGLAAAHVLAKAGAEVVVFERGEYPGTKNMFGGVFYTTELNGLLPSFWETAPVERHVTRRVLSCLTETASVAFEYRDQRMAAPPYNGFTVLRTKFDRWFADQVAEAGALIVPGTVVDDVLVERDCVAGVQVRRPEGILCANVVIAADGANSLLAKRAGLQNELGPRDVAIGVKELLALPRKTIEERFGLRDREGAAHEYVGLATRGVQGGGFIYTNRDSLSVGIVTQAASLKASGRRLSSLLEDFKAHPSVSDLLRDSTLLEYSAHLIPEAGLNMMPGLYRAGMLVAGDAAALVLGTGLSLEGANYAVASGICAGQTALEALSRGDFGARALAGYEERLRNGFVLRDLKTFQRAPAFLSNARVYNAYPEIMCEMARRVFTVDGRPKQRLWRTAWQCMRSHMSPLDVLGDIWKGGRAL